MLVWSLQGEAQDAPDSFRSKVLLISLSAYLVLFAFMVALVIGLRFMWSLNHASVYFKYLFFSSLIVIVPIVWLTLRMLFTKIPPPEGRELHSEEAPQLFEMLDELRDQVRGTPVHHVLIVDEFTAAVAQHPRLGLFGGYRNYLILGLPMLYALPAGEFKAVIAHEYGHLAGGHNKFTRWIGRQRITFGLLHDHVKQRREDNAVNRVLAGMLDWFAPYFNAYTFVLKRQHEYEADALSSAIAGAQSISSALIRTNLLAGWLRDKFWKKIYEQAVQHAVPPFMPFVSMRKLLVVTMDEWSTKERLDQVWKDESDIYDTHPCLRERVLAVEQRPALPGIFKACAADALLGKFAQTLAREFDEKWWAGEKQKWQSYHGRYHRSIVRIAELEQWPVAELHVTDAQELALLLVEFRSLEAAKAVLQNLVKRPGERYPKPVYYYGCVLLSENNERGLDYLEEAYRLSHAMWDDCAGTGYHWLCRNRSVGAAEDWLQRMRDPA